MSAVPIDFHLLERSLREASGFSDLEMFDEATATLQALPLESRALPQVQHSWCELEAAQHLWAALRDRARRLCESHPTDSVGWFWLGFATRRADSTGAAYEALKPVVGKFAAEQPVVDYNFSCYAAVEGHLDEAKTALIRLFRQDPKWRAVARKDSDLESLKEWLRKSEPQ